MVTGAPRCMTSWCNSSRNRLEFDELWSFVGKKQRRITPADPADMDDQYVFIGIDANLKAIISYRVGKRDSDNANEFLADLRRISGPSAS